MGFAYVLDDVARFQEHGDLHGGVPDVLFPPRRVLPAPDGGLHLGRAGERSQSACIRTSKTGEQDNGVFLDAMWMNFLAAILKDYLRDKVGNGTSRTRLSTQSSSRA